MCGREDVWWIHTHSQPIKWILLLKPWTVHRIRKKPKKRKTEKTKRKIMVFDYISFAVTISFVCHLYGFKKYFATLDRLLCVFISDYDVYTHIYDYTSTFGCCLLFATTPPVGSESILMHYSPPVLCAKYFCCQIHRKLIKIQSVKMV